MLVGVLVVRFRSKGQDRDTPPSAGRTTGISFANPSYDTDLHATRTGGESSYESVGGFLVPLAPTAYSTIPGTQGGSAYAEVPSSNVGARATMPLGSLFFPSFFSPFFFSPVLMVELLID